MVFSHRPKTLAGVCAGVCMGLLLVIMITVAAAAPVVHTVRRGDTLSEIAARYRVSQEQIRQWNGLRSSRILVGQRLEIWPAGRSNDVHVLRPGDPLSVIAVRHGVSVAELRRLNRLPSDRIYPGQTLRLREASSPSHHVVAPGENLSRIAQRHGTSVQRLRALNGLRNDTIHPGQRLTVSAVGTVTDDYEETPLEYTVRRGDTLSEIAQRFEVGLRLLRSLNHLQSDVIYPGQKLQLRPSELEEGVHVVRYGETLSGIAGRYRTDVATLRRINGISGSTIYVGQKLRLRETPRARHIVERGDALWEIARAYGMSVREIKELNGLTSDRIHPGQELVLSGTRARQYDEYVVQPGDHMTKIARLHQMSVAELQQINQIIGTIIHPGDRLKVRPFLGGNLLDESEIDWESLHLNIPGVARLDTGNGPYYYTRPRADRQPNRSYYENAPGSPMTMYRRARTLWEAFEHQVDQLGRLSNRLAGWHIVLDPGHGGLDPGAIVTAVDGNGNQVVVVEHEYVYDIALRAYVLLRLHGARVEMTVLSPNHLIRNSNPPAHTFVNEKNEVYNSLEHNRSNRQSDWPSGNNLMTRVQIARGFLAGAPRGRRMFLSFHADIEPRAPEVPLVLYYTSRNGRTQDLTSRGFARSMLPYLGAGARTRGQALGVLRNNPADYKVIFELRNMAYRDHVWALRFAELRQRDAEKVVRGVLEFTQERSLSAQR